jgi:hypothetical protein
MMQTLAGASSGGNGGGGGSDESGLDAFITANPSVQNRPRAEQAKIYSEVRNARKGSPVTAPLKPAPTPAASGARSPAGIDTPYKKKYFEWRGKMVRGSDLSALRKDVSSYYNRNKSSMSAQEKKSIMELGAKIGLRLQ